MATVTLKNIPEELYEELKRIAAANGRTINGEIIVCLEKAINSHRMDIPEILTRARALREKIRYIAITDEALNRVKAETCL